MREGPVPAAHPFPSLPLLLVLPCTDLHGVVVLDKALQWRYHDCLLLTHCNTKAVRICRLRYEDTTRASGAPVSEEGDSSETYRMVRLAMLQQELFRSGGPFQEGLAGVGRPAFL